MFSGLIAKLAANVFFRNARSFLKRIPRWMWVTLAVVIAIVIASLVHQHYAGKRIAAAYAQGEQAADEKWQTAFDSMQATSETWRNRYQEQSLALTQYLGDQHAQTLRDNAVRADTLRLRGPGAAAARCGPGIATGLPSLPGAADGSSAEPDVAGSSVPSGDGFAVVPWGWLVQRAEEHDALLSEVTTARTWHTEQEQLWNESVSALRSQQP